MEEKNPYENHETVDIPDFSSIKSDDDDIDRSIFKMNDQDENEDYDEEEDEEYEEDEEPSYKKVRSSVVVIAGIVMAVLLVIAIFSIVWGMSKNNKYNSLQSEYDAYVTTSKQQITELNSKITELQEQINKSSSSDSSSDTTTTGDTYKVSNALTVPLKLRTGAGTSNGQVKFADLSSELQAIATEDNEYAYVTNNATFTVTETKDDSDGNTWGKLADNVWVCLKYGDETWCSKQ